MYASYLRSIVSDLCISRISSSCNIPSWLRTLGWVIPVRSRYFSEHLVISYLCIKDIRLLCWRYGTIFLLCAIIAAVVWSLFRITTARPSSICTVVSSDWVDVFHYQTQRKCKVRFVWATSNACNVLIGLHKKVSSHDVCCGKGRTWRAFDLFSCL